MPRTTIVEIAPTEQAQMLAEIRHARYGYWLALHILLLCAAQRSHLGRVHVGDGELGGLGRRAEDDIVVQLARVILLNAHVQAIAEPSHERESPNVASRVRRITDLIDPSRAILARHVQRARGRSAPRALLRRHGAGRCVEVTAKRDHV